MLQNARVNDGPSGKSAPPTQMPRAMGRAIPEAPARQTNGFGGYAPAPARQTNGFGGYAPAPARQTNGFGGFALNNWGASAGYRPTAIPAAAPSAQPRARPKPQGPARANFSMDKLQEYLQQAQSKGRPKPKRQPKFGDDDWVNPQYNPNRNAGGYTRFDYKQTGSGLERAKTYKDGARIFDSYNKLKSGQPGYTHGNFARSYLKETFNTTPAKATDIQKFEAMDMAMRDVQRKNRRPKRKFGVGDVLGIASLATGFTGVGLAPKLLGKTAGRAVGFGSGSKWLTGK